MLFNLPIVGFTLPGTYNPNARETDACKVSHRLWTRKRGRYARVDISESVVSNVRPTVRDNTGQNTGKRHSPSSCIEINIHGPAGNRTRVLRLEGRNSADYAMEFNRQESVIETPG